MSRRICALPRGGALSPGKSASRQPAGQRASRLASWFQSGGFQSGGFQSVGFQSVGFQSGDAQPRIGRPPGMHHRYIGKQTGTPGCWAKKTKRQQCRVSNRVLLQKSGLGIVFATILGCPSTSSGRTDKPARGEPFDELRTGPSIHEWVKLLVGFWNQAQ